MASLYVHIPFCERKCVYCDFYSVEGARGMDAFLDALSREIALAAPAARGVGFGTLYFGGGTPSLLSGHQLEGIMRALRAAFLLAHDAEVTLEANPGTITAASLAAYRALGVNRLSLGIQSLDEHELGFLGRIHDVADALRAVPLAREAGFDNVSIDLIYAIPGQTVERWDSTLRRALALGPDHVSAYSLIVEDHTPLARMVSSGAIAAAPEEHEAALYERTMAVMERHGFEHYEVSSYARPGRRSRHNSAYWSHEQYIGLGPSAHSFWRGGETAIPVRSANAASLRAYTAALARGERPVAMSEQIAPPALQTEKIFLGLRSGGIDLEMLDAEFGPRKARRALARALAEEGSAVLEGGRMRLTARGYLLCDEIAARMMD